MRARVVSLILLLGTIATVAAANGPTATTLTPVSTGTIGQPVPITLTLEGTAGDNATVTLFHRTGSASAWSKSPMVARGDGRFQGEIPANGTNDLAVRYYITASGPGAEWQVSVGSIKSPLSIDLLEAPAAAASSLWFKLGLTLSLALAGSGGISLRNRYLRHQVLDKAFWMKTLGPLHGMPGPRLAQEIRRLCGTPLQHPVKGLTIFPRTTFTRKLYEIGLWNERALERDLALFAPEMKLSPNADAATASPRATRSPAELVGAGVAGSTASKSGTPRAGRSGTLPAAK